VPAPRPDVIYDALHVSEWGLAGLAYAPFTVAYPASSVAALAAFWSAHTEQLIAFEESHPAVCRRVRYEDLAADPHRVAGSILAFLSGSPEPAEQPHSAGYQDLASSDAPQAARTPLPADQIPPQLLTRIDKLMTDLSYPRLQAVNHSGHSS
jgi:hypothetical protein